MGLCGGGATNAPKVEPPKELTLYGNNLDNSSRSIKMICRLSNVKLNE